MSRIFKGEDLAGLVSKWSGGELRERVPALLSEMAGAGIDAEWFDVTADEDGPAMAFWAVTSMRATTGTMKWCREDWHLEEREGFEDRAMPVLEAVAALPEEWYSYDTGWQCNVCNGNGPGNIAPGTGPDGYDHKDRCPVPAIEAYRKSAKEPATDASSLPHAPDA